MIHIGVSSQTSNMIASNMQDCCFNVDCRRKITVRTCSNWSNDNIAANLSGVKIKRDKK